MRDASREIFVERLKAMRGHAAEARALVHLHVGEAWLVVGAHLGSIWQQFGYPVVTQSNQYASKMADLQG